MKDLGFGVIDRQAVFALLAGLALGHLIIGVQLPFDASDVKTLFVDLLWFTGYVFLVRITWRLPFALGESIYEVYNNVVPELVRDSSERSERDRPMMSMLKSGVGLIRALFVAFLATGMWIANFDKRIAPRPDKIVEGLPGQGKIAISMEPFWRKVFRVILGVVDRLVLVLAALSIYIPVIQRFAWYVGIAGLVLLLITYVARGSYTFLFPDNIEKHTT